jgi:hypothetical protein
MKDKLFAARKENLARLVAEKYEGNRAALSRACGIHQNQINLMLTNNEEHRRNMGEDLARRMEQTLGIPVGYFDQERRPSVLGDVIHIKSVEIPEDMVGAVRVHDEVNEIAVYSTLMLAMQSRITSPNSLIACLCASSDAAPAVVAGDTLVVDVNARHITSDGIYLFKHGSGSVMRRVRAKFGGGWVVEEPGGAVDVPKGMRVTGRVVASYRQSML